MSFDLILNQSLRVKLNEANETIKKQQEKLAAKDDEVYFREELRVSKRAFYS